MCPVCGDELTSRPTIDVNDTDEGRRLSHPSRERRYDDEVATVMAILASSTEPYIASRLVRGNASGRVPGRVDYEDLAGMTLPPESLDPQAGTARARPASHKALGGLKRTVLAPESAELFEASVSLFEPRCIADPSWSFVPSTAASVVLNAVPGEFVYGERQCESLPIPCAAAIVVCTPRTVKGGTLSTRTLSEIASLRRRRVPFVAYVERGDGVTFVQKALACQRAGEITTANKETMCVGVIVGNSMSGSGKEIWPYVMQDTKEEAKRFGLKVPVVMVRRDDGMRLVGWSSSPNDAEDVINYDTKTYTPCLISILSKESNSHTCPVCTDSYAPGDTIVRLPLCGHVFHEACALTWLTKHNTCPNCRMELPTDDDDYERERRRREANAERGVDVGDVHGHDIYG